MHSRTISIFLFGMWPLLSQDVDDRMKRYNDAVRGCADNSCKDAAEQAAADLVAALVKRPTAAIAGALGQTVALDTNEGRRVALRLLPDNQLGAGSGVGGGTTLASLAGVSELITGAMESGAFQKDTAGTVSTFRANLAGTYRMLSGECPKAALQLYPACIGEDRSALRGLSVVVSLDSSRSSQPVPSPSLGAVFLRARNGLSAAGVRYEFYRPVNQNTKDAKTDWSTKLAGLRTTGAEYGAALEAGPGSVIVPTIADRMPEKMHLALLLLPEGERLTAAERMLADFVTAKKLTIAKDKWDNFKAARAAHMKSQVKFFKNVLDRRILTVEFTDQRPKDEPVYGNLNFIFGKTVGSHEEANPLPGVSASVTVPDWNLTLNAGANFYYDTKAAQPGRRLRDVHVAFQADHKMWHWKFLNMPTFTLAVYFQNLTDNSVLAFNSDSIAPGTGIVLPKPANVILMGTKGKVGIGQAKLTIPFKDSGVSFPLAVTWSNRTELLNIPGNDVRGQFGLMFDMDKLMTTLQGKAK